MIASRATLEALQYPELLALVAAEARTDLGRARLAATCPAVSADELDQRRAAFVEVERLAGEAPLVPSLDAELEPLVERLESERPPLDGAEILLVARLLVAGAEAASRIAGADPPCPELARRLEGLGDPAPLVVAVERVLDPRGRVRDDASPRLVELGREVRASRDRIYSRLERLRSENAELFTEETVPMRGGRLLLVLGSGGRGRIPGLVHGRSASGRSFYFEPLDAVEENNTLQTAVEEQEAERQRLLRELLAAFAGELPLVRRLAALVGELDLHEAAGRFAATVAGRLPELAPPGRARLVAARHPLLDPRLAERRERVLGAAGQRRDVVPLDLELGGERRVLVVTGPNAGGKTVALKTLGLAALAAQSALPFSCAAGSALPYFASVVATVGDEQDLLAERSTFSGRLERLGEVWRVAAPASLALVDELGSGTDPEEGAALAQALVERLVEAGGMALVTTHLSTVALAALERPGAACAAMEFDPASGEPTYRILPGAPGASEAIALARRLALPREWIARAEALVGPEHRELGRVLAELEAQRRELARATAEARTGAAAAESAIARLERERAALEAERHSVAARLKRELASFRERVQRELSGEVERVREEARRGRRKGVAPAAAERLLADAPNFGEPAEPPTTAKPSPGDSVRHVGLGWRGRLERVAGGRAEVFVGGKRMRCRLDELAKLAAEEPAPSAPPTGSGLAEVEVGPELMLLGATVEEAIATVDETLDRALRAGRGELRIVHGHGTGRLREAVRAYLRTHPGVASQRPGAPNEGGNGATVVTLRD